MTPELRHGLYAVDPKDLGGDKYEAEREQDRENEKARLAKERARLKKQEKEGRMQPDPEIVKGLLDMSFSENGARRAALKTKNKSFNAALDWAMEHSEDKDFEDPLPGYDDDDVDGGGKKEDEGAGGEDGGAPGKKKKGSKSKNAKMIPLELQRLFARLQLLDARTVSTEDLTERGFKWKNDEGRMQHDAHELIRLLIDRLERDMKHSKVNAGLVSALYEGDLANQVAGQEDLVTSLLSYTRPERLSGDNKYFCDQCQEKQDALRSQTLRALPPVLIFSLNRFEFDFETMERVKVKQEFKYPLTLDMEPFVEGRAWSGNDNSDESQVPELAGDPEVPGTCRNRQKWVPQAWNDAQAEAITLQTSLAATSDHGQAAKDCLQEGRWLPPSGLNPSQPAHAGEDEEKEGVGLGGDGGGQDEGKKSDGPLGVGTGLAGPMELLLEVFEDAPKHQDLGKPCMQLKELRAKTRSRLGGKRWDKVFKPRLDKFIMDHADVFMLQETETSGVEVLLLHRPGGGEGDAAEPPAGNAAESGGGGAPGADGQQSLAPANGTALADTVGDGGGGGGNGSAASKAVPPGAVDALASEKHGRWFSFDDRKVTPISIRDLQKPFEGAETAYLLIYRSRNISSIRKGPL
ncbi:unnamed protein product [Ectocarpus sp. CCAP 1310/34]|nr:unnamed protein product [Ectocarpus sp. CCAP 1310/34]